MTDSRVKERVIVHPKIKVSHHLLNLQVVPILYEFISYIENKRRSHPLTSMGSFLQWMLSIVWLSMLFFKKY